jgi:acyl-homoserine-lactone acylase
MGNAFVFIGFIIAQAAAIPRVPGEARVIRDDWGVPHIYAAREENGYFGLGYALAEDRLGTLLYRYVAASGRLAEVFGADSLPKDIERARWMHIEAAKRAYTRMPKQLRQNYDGFAAGIQRYLDTHPLEGGGLRQRIEPWMPIAWTRSWAFYWDEGTDECAAAGVRLAGSKADPHPMSASNAMTLSPWRTSDRAAVLIADSHSSFTGNGEMFEFHMDAGPIKVSGTSGTGSPWVIVGHTKSAAWTTTNRNSDAGDCYLVRVDPRDSLRYRYDGKWQRMVTRTVTIPVKGQAPVKKTFAYTLHNGMLNPVIARNGDSAWVSANVYGQSAELLDEQMYRQLHADNVQELIEAQGMLAMFPTNVIAADRHGNTLYLRAGRIPVRPPGFDWTKPLDGTTSQTAWRGFHPVTSLVQIVNPAPGYMQNTNVSPDVMFEESPMTPERYPPEVFSDAPRNQNSRGRRAINLLSRQYSATLADVTDILFDEKWPEAATWIESLRRAANRDSGIANRTSDFRQFLHHILTFDGYARKESEDALPYLYWRMAVVANSAAIHELVRLGFADSIAPAQYDTVLLNAAQRASAAMKTELGSVDKQLGDIYRVGRADVSLPLGGFVGTLRVMVHGPPDNNQQRWVHTGQRQPMVVMFTNPIQSFSSLNFGQSNRPDSPHFADQSRLMSERRLKPTYFYEQDLLKHVESEVVLKRASAR